MAGAVCGRTRMAANVGLTVVSVGLAVVNVGLGVASVGLAGYGATRTTCQPSWVRT